MEEYQQYRESEAWQRDAAFWAEQRRQLPPPASLSPAPLAGRSASADILRLKLEFTDGEFRQLATQLSGVQRTDLALALAALWLGRLCNRMDYAAGFIFMRRLGSAALTASGPVLNVLPLGIHIAAQETLPELATRLAAQLKKMRRHQRYDAEQIVRDSGERQVMNRCLVRYSILRYLITNWIFLVFRRKPIPWQPVRLMTLNWPCSRMNTVI